jgi:hypothetical protein
VRVSGRKVGNFWFANVFLGKSRRAAYAPVGWSKGNKKNMTKKSLEKEVKSFLSRKEVKFRDNSSSYRCPDFTVLYKNEPYIYLEVKEKRQEYNISNWPEYVEEKNLFILDDLTVRKCLHYSPISGVLVRDNVRGIYVFLSIVDLALMPRKRLNRSIRRKVSSLKGKWLIDLRNGVRTKSIKDAFSKIREYIEAKDEILFETNECYGDYRGEEIVRGGITRRPFHWETDVESTR